MPNQFVASFKFKADHLEVHYLVNPRTRGANRFSLAKSSALPFASEADALAAINKILDRGNRGLWGGYHFMATAERADA